MRIGLKLDLDFRTAPSYRTLFGERDAPSTLQTLGVGAVEAPTGPDTPNSAVQTYARRCVAAGLRVSLHPYTEGLAVNPASFDEADENPCRAYFEQTFALAGEVARLQHGPVIVNIHPAAVPPGQMARDAQVAQSVRFFRWVREWTGTHEPRVEPVAELQIRPGADEDMLRIGDSYAELLSVVACSGIGTCWDFGHATMNHRNQDEPLEPPPEFLPPVRHVHCHDVNESGDHQPLLFGGVPWQGWLNQLGLAGFDDTVIIEVPAERFLAMGGMGALEKSIDAVIHSMATP